MTYNDFQKIKAVPCKLEKYIKPGEAAELMRFQKASEYFMSVRIYYEIFMSRNAAPDMKECGGVFHAGYVAGIRAERDKRRRKAAEVDTTDISPLARRCHSLVDCAAHAGQEALLLHIVELLDKHR